MNALFDDLGIQGTVMDDLIRHRPSGTDYLGVEVGSYHGHWAISGDFDLAFRSGSDHITFVPWANLGADFDGLASGGSKVSLGELAEIQLNAGTLAVLLSGLPADRRKIPIRIEIPRQQRWLRMLDGLHQGVISHEDYLAYVELVSRSSLFAEEFFRDLLRDAGGRTPAHPRVRPRRADARRPASHHGPRQGPGPVPGRPGRRHAPQPQHAVDVGARSGTPGNGRCHGDDRHH